MQYSGAPGAQHPRAAPGAVWTELFSRLARDSPAARGAEVRAEAVLRSPAMDAQPLTPSTTLPAGPARVLRAFLVDGRLERIPAQEKKRQVILRFLAEVDFDPGRSYPEKEVNQRLALRNPDVAALRRYLVDSRYMEREAGVYRLRPRTEWPALEGWPTEDALDAADTPGACASTPF